MDDVAREMARLRASDDAREIAALRARLAESEARERRRIVVALILLNDAIHTSLSPSITEGKVLVTNLLASFCANEGIRYVDLVREAHATLGALAPPWRAGRPAARRRVWGDDAGPRDDGIEGPEDGFAVG